MFGKAAGKKAQMIESLIGAGMTVEGNLTFKSGLRIDGTVRGNVSAAEGESSMLVISELARVEGEIHAAHIVVNGTIVGPVHVAELIELQPKARISGDVFYTALEMHQGAVVDGRLLHEDTAKPALKLAASNA
jgi:cytoskeletal protein CcmA (bactofilin family)